MTSQNTQPPATNLVAKLTDPKYVYSQLVPMLKMEEDKELTLPMVLLTGRENSQVEANAFQDTLNLFRGKAPKTDEPSNWDQQLEAQRAYWTVFMATRLPTDLKKKWFLTKEQVEEEYNWDEIGVLMNHHMTVRLSQPTLKNIDPNDPQAFQKTIDMIKKMGMEGDFFLNGFTTHSVNQLMKYLVLERETLLKNSGLSGTP